jgi:hypothetical protein
MSEKAPILFGDDRYYLRMECADMERLEINFGPLFTMFEMGKFGHYQASKLMWVMLYKPNDEGELVHAIPQTNEGKDEALEWVKKFTGNFEDPMVGIALLFGSFKAGLVASGWIKEAPAEHKVADTKNPKKPRKSSTKATSKRGSSTS